MHRTLIGCVCVVAASMLPLPAAGQITTGSIVGTVRDPSAAVVPGVEVSLSGERLMGARETTTDERGRYRVTNLPPGLYELSFRAPGFVVTRRTGVRVQVGATTEEDATLKLAGQTEEVTVMPSEAVVDTTSSGVDAHYGRDWVDNAPLLRQSFFDILASAPGVDPAPTSADNGAPGSYGSLLDQNLYQLDGIDLSDNFTGFPTTQVQPSLDVVEEVQILSLGAPAEYGNHQGAVFNIVTRQGTNEFHGSAAYYHQSAGLTGRNTTDEEDGGHPFERVTYRNATGQIGGPIMKDRLWFFGAFEHLSDSSAVGVEPEFADDVKLDHFFGKLNLQLSPKHNLVGTFNVDDEDVLAGLLPSDDPSTRLSSARNVIAPSLTYTGAIGERTALETRYAGFYTSQRTGAAPDASREFGTLIIDLDSGRSSGAIFAWFDFDLSRTTLSAKLSHYSSEFLGGSHDFKFGVQYTDAPVHGDYMINDRVYAYTAGGVQYGYGYDYNPFSYGGTATTVSGFVDDSLRAGSRLTLNVGLRYDNTRTSAFEANELDARAMPTGKVFPGVDYYTWNTLSPRVGFNWKLTADGKTVVKGHYGRYYRGGSTGEFITTVPSISPTYFGIWNFATNQFEDSVLAFDNTNTRFDTNLRAPKTDQFALSVERELFGKLNLEATYLYKRSRDFTGWQDIGGVYAPITYVDSVGAEATGRSFTVFQLQNSIDDRFFLFTSPPDTRADVHALSVTAAKRMSEDWQLTTSATLMRSTTDRIQGVLGQLNFREFGKSPNDFVNSDGRAPRDRSFTFKTQVLYTGLPGGFTIGAYYFYADGYPTRRVVRIPATRLPNLVMSEPRTTEKRFPGRHQVDLRVQKDFKMGGQVRLSAFANVFNVLNDASYQGFESDLATAENYHRPSRFNLPRRAMLGAKVEF